MYICMHYVHMHMYKSLKLIPFSTSAAALRTVVTEASLDVPITLVGESTPVVVESQLSVLSNNYYNTLLVLLEIQRQISEI